MGAARRVLENGQKIHGHSPPHPQHTHMHSMHNSEPRDTGVPHNREDGGRTERTESTGQRAHGHAQKGISPPPQSTAVPQHTTCTHSDAQHGVFGGAQPHSTGHVGHIQNSEGNGQRASGGMQHSTLPPPQHNAAQGHNAQPPHTSVTGGAQHTAGQHGAPSRAEEAQFGRAAGVMQENTWANSGGQLVEQTVLQEGTVHPTPTLTHGAPVAQNSGQHREQTGAQLAKSLRR